jgi:membrane-associated phospholipid phosphatase
MEEVRRLGGEKSKDRTEEQTLIAKFWSDFSYTSTPPGHWNHIARDLVRVRQLPLAETARLFALLNVAMADAGIAVWDTKYHYNLWRPITAIRRAGEDGNAATAPDPAWMSLLPSPPHPEYVSGHAGFSGAAARILAQQFGGDAVELATTSDSVPGVVRHFHSFQSCAEEIARSRVYGGIHYAMSGRAGLALGKRVAEHTLKEFDGLELRMRSARNLAANAVAISPQKP